jgi:hypothetical protein
LITEIRQTVHRYVDLDPFFEMLCAYYVLFTWTYDTFRTVPYLRFQGDYGSGKSRAREVVGAMCFRPMRASGAATVSPIFRMLDTWRGTLLLEEADYSHSDYNSDVVKIMNQGYDREQGIVLRSGDKNSGFETEAYVVFGPKVIAMRGEFADRALSSRCLTKEMVPTIRTDLPIELPREFHQLEAPRLRAMLLRYRLERWQPHVDLDYDAVDLSVEPRLNQITLALYSIVDDQTLRDDLSAFIREYNRQLIAERGMTLAAKVLEAIVVQWELESDRSVDKRDLSVKTVAGIANYLLDYENYGLEEMMEAAKNREPLKPKSVGAIARTQLQLATDRTGPGGRYAIEYNETRISALRKRYGIDDDRLVNLLEAIYQIQAQEQERKQNQSKPVHF